MKEIGIYSIYTNASDLLEPLKSQKMFNEWEMDFFKELTEKDSDLMNYKAFININGYSEAIYFKLNTSFYYNILNCNILIENDFKLTNGIIKQINDKFSVYFHILGDRIYHMDLSSIPSETDFIYTNHQFYVPFNKEYSFDMLSINSYRQPF